MRKYLLLLFLQSGTLLYSQTDTLQSFFNAQQATVIASPNGGYVSGTNGYGDKEKLQVFLPEGNYSILGALVWIAKKEVLSTGMEESQLTLKMRRFDATPTQTVPFYAGPKEVLDSVAFPLSQIQASLSLEEGLNYLPFSNPVFAGQPYGISVSFENMLPEDTLAIMHSAVDSVLAEGQSWEIWNGNWRRIIDNWGLNIDFAIFPVIDSTLNGSKPISILDFAVYPNPANASVSLSLESLFQGTPLTYSICDLNGKAIHTYTLPQFQKTTSIDVRGISEGCYLIKVQSGQKVGVKPIIIAH